MHRLIQRGRVRSQVINVPEGLPELLSDITREVLRCQPTTECLCQFIIDYLNSVIATRHKAKLAKAVIDRALRNVDEAIGDMCVCDIPKDKAENMCEAMEECFRRFLAQRRCEKGKKKELTKFNEFDMLDELMQKCKFTMDELKASQPVIEAAYQKFIDAYMTAKESSDGTDSLYQYFREREITRLEVRLKEEAAVKIQSLFRGFLVRKSLFVDKPTQKSVSVDLPGERDEMLMEAAAIKIQKFLRRHLNTLDRFEENEDVEEEFPGYRTLSSNISIADQPAEPEENYDVNKIRGDTNRSDAVQKEFLVEEQDVIVMEDERSELDASDEAEADSEIEEETNTENQTD